MALLANSELERRAAALLTSVAISRAPVSVERIARKIGAQIRFSPLDEELSGMVYVKEGTPIIGVNSLHHPNRQRFTIAHEIAHLELHRDAVTAAVHVDKGFPENALRRDGVSATGTERLEIEANRFAAALLIPREILEHELERKPIELIDESVIDGLARKFRVSNSTLQFRLRTLALLMQSDAEK